MVVSARAATSVQLAHIALTLIGEGKVHYRGQWRPTLEVMAENGLKPMSIHIREGLSVTNGTSVMTGVAVVNQFYAERLFAVERAGRRVDERDRCIVRRLDVRPVEQCSASARPASDGGVDAQHGFRQQMPDEA